MSEPRYALYAVPEPGSALARFAAAWLGRDIETGESVGPPERAGLPADLHREVTAEPRRYGFHGTLKAPFRLAVGVHEAGAIVAAKAFAAERGALAPIPLKLAALGRFLALVPAAPSAELHALANGAVEQLDSLRAPLSAVELERRHKAPLTPPQAALLQRWGYPYVMDQFRYHMTLTGPLEPDVRARITDVLTPLLAPIVAAPYAIEDVALCIEPTPDLGFRVLRRFGLLAVDSR